MSDLPSGTGNERLQYLQRESDIRQASTESNGIIYILQAKLASLMNDLFIEMSTLGNKSIYESLDSFSVIVHKGDNAALLGIIFIFVGLVGIAFSKENTM